jgi:hypothetical protein
MSMARKTTGWRPRWSKWTHRNGATGPSRRAFLGGAAAMIALPWLESLAMANPTDPPLRMLFWYFPNGMRMDRWTPAQTGENYTTTELLTPIEALREKVLVLSNLTHLPGADNVAGDHARGTAAFLTAQRAARPEEPVQLGVSVDYVASQSAAADGTPFRSLQLANANQPTSGDCDSGYSCAYMNSVTWSGPDTPMAPRTDPATTFATLFAGLDPLTSLAAQQRRHARRESILDYVIEDAESLRTQLSSADQQKVDQYLTGIRDLETRLENNPPNNGNLVCDPGTAPDGYTDIRDQTDQFIDILVKAIECDSTRVLSMMADSAGSYRSFPFLGVPEAHHEMSHWATGSQAEQDHRLTQWQAICHWHVEQFAELLTRLDAIDDTNGTTLLDNTLCFFSSEISDGNAHNHDDMPVLLAGGGARTVPGQHIHYANPTPIANLFLAMLDQFGAPQPTFGLDGDGVLPGIFL